MHEEDWALSQLKVAGMTYHKDKNYKSSVEECESRDWDETADQNDLPSDKSFPLSEVLLGYWRKKGNENRRKVQQNVCKVDWYLELTIQFHLEEDFGGEKHWYWVTAKLMQVS